MLNFNVFFNYNNERYRARLFLIIEFIIVGTLLMISIPTLDADEVIASPVKYILIEVYPYCLRLSVWIVILGTFIIFIRNLYDRFVALNYLLR